MDWTTLGLFCSAEILQEHTRKKQQVLEELYAIDGKEQTCCTFQLKPVFHHIYPAPCNMYHSRIYHSEQKAYLLSTLKITLSSIVESVAASEFNVLMVSSAHHQINEWRVPYMVESEVVRRKSCGEEFGKVLLGATLYFGRQNKNLEIAVSQTQGLV